ncbi:hypothetical protein [Formosa sp. S-31]|uniref:hypothetical protein n=1 Tax=Formosa sp. S-31 TaxID=2790949 RepID=UPI003EC023D3
MKKHIFLTISILYCFILSAQVQEYKSLDTSNPITLLENKIVYKQDTITLGPLSFFIDGQLSDDQTASSPYIFNSVNEAVKHLKDGTETSPMVLHIAPYVYWIDNPDDPEIRIPEIGNIPYGLKIKCDWLKFNGLTENPEHVVLACNRGQTLGAKGNFTMLHIDGDGTASENITFGNYCNVDLVYPLKPDFNRKKRGSAIVQAQLIICNGDKIYARNTHFISRLNLCPFVGAKRVFFNNCHFESTDDALSGTAVYKNSSFEFYSSKPFYHTTGTGAIFLNCNIRVLTKGPQYFTKANGQLAVVDTKFTGNDITYLGWCDEINPTTKNYQLNNTLNNQSIFIDQEHPKTTVNLENTATLNAYKFIYQGKTIYNTYNLLRGEDDWDPEHIKPLVLKAEKDLNISLTDLPTQLKITLNQATLETNRDRLKLTAELFKFGNIPASTEPIIWYIPESDKSFLLLNPSETGTSCFIIPQNFTDFKKEVCITAKTASGLQAACIITVNPSKLSPPKFENSPTIELYSDSGTVEVDYLFKDFQYTDQSQITWYRCLDSKGSNPLKIAVSRLNQPLNSYQLTGADIGKYIMVTVHPKHQRSDYGSPQSFVFEKPITEKNIKENPNLLFTDFKTVPAENQTKIIPGMWTFSPLNNENATPGSETKNAWTYKMGSQGSKNQYGLLQTGRTASMSYTPENKIVSPLKLTLEVSPFKTAGQGFSVAPLYMDIVINFDPNTKSGYGLRFIRTSKHGNAVDCYFVSYKNNVTKAISEPVTTSCFRTPCQIVLEQNGNTLKAQAECLEDYPKNGYPDYILPKIDIETEIPPLPFNSFGIEYNGGSSTMINYIKAEAEGINFRPK